MEKKFKKIISVLGVVLMLTTLFAGMPASFAEEKDAEDDAYIQEKVGEFLEGDDVENVDDPEVMGEEEFPMPEEEPKEDLIKPQDDGEPVAELSLQDGEQGHPLVIGEGEEKVTLYPNFYIEDTLNDSYERYNGNIKLKVIMKWSSQYGAAYKDTDAVALQKYQDLVAKGWQFKYSIVTKEGEPYGEELTYEQIGPDAGVELDVAKDKEYYLKVKATLNEQVVEADSLDQTIHFEFPAVPSGLKVSCEKDCNTVYASWNKASKAEGYFLFRNNKSGVPVKPIYGTDIIEGLKDEQQKVPACKKYYYYVRSVYKMVTGGRNVYIVSDPSSADTVKVNEFLNEGIHQITWKAKLKKKGVLYAAKNCKKKKGGSIPKGTTVKVVGKYPARFPREAHAYSFQVQLIKNDEIVKRGWIRYGTITSVKGVVAYKKGKALDWSRDFKEYYMNLRGFSSSTKYLIWTSTYTQRVNVFKGKKGNWKLIRTMRCTTGKFDHPTALTYKRKLIKHQYKRVRTKINNPNSTYWYKYVSYFCNGDGFHSIVWDTKTGKLIRKVVKNLQPGTLGCVRMSVDDSKWIYTKMPLKTRTIFR